MDTYWNHNTAYHAWISKAASKTRGNILDIGCGDGLLMQRLAPLASTLTGIEPHPPTCAKARSRLAAYPHARVLEIGFDEFDAQEKLFDLIVFVASLHHMPQFDALCKARDLLKPGGILRVVGISANATVVDWTTAVLSTPIVRLLSLIHKETRDIAVPTIEPRETLSDIKESAQGLMPGVKIRRALYYRYLLTWTKPLPPASSRTE